MADTAPGVAGDNSRAFRMLVYCVQFFFGGWFFVHGLNHWFQFFPQPPGSSPAGAGLISSMIDAGMFDLVKGMEVVSGALLLANRWVPLGIVLAFPIGVSIAFFDHTTNGDWFGTGTAIVIMSMLCLMAVAHLDKYLPMLVFDQGEPSLKGVKRLLGKAEGEG